MLRLLLLAVVAGCVFEGVRSGMSRLDVRAHNMLRAAQPLSTPSSPICVLLYHGDMRLGSHGLNAKEGSRIATPKHLMSV